jgi:ABC-type phosphate/phosphonate transport system ATPase subunit
MVCCVFQAINLVNNYRPRRSARAFASRQEASNKLYTVLCLVLMANDISYIEQNINLTKNLFLLNEVIIPKLLKRSLYLQSLTFPQIKEIVSDEKYNIIINDFKTFLDQSQYYLNNFEDPCQ